MTTNMRKLKGKIVEAGMTQDVLADAMGIDRSTFYRKMRTSGNAFSVADVQNIIQALSLSDSDVFAIFFNREVA